MIANPKFVFLSVILFFIIGACDKNNPPPPEPADSSFTAKVSGNQFTANARDAWFDNDKMIISGINNQGRAIILELTQFSGIGSYPILLNNGGAYMPDTSDAATVFITKSEENQMGEIKVLVWDETDSLLGGTFNFEAENLSGSASISVTEGVFENVKALPEAPWEIGGNNNTLSVDIDGLPWNNNTVSGAIGGNLIDIVANSKSDNTQIGLSFPLNLTAGNYNFDPIAGISVFYVDNNLQTYFVEPGGVLTIMQHDVINHLVVGTFNFVGKNVQSSDTLIFTNGTFSVVYF